MDDDDDVNGEGEEGAEKSVGKSVKGSNCSYCLAGRVRIKSECAMRWKSKTCV